MWAARSRWQAVSSPPCFPHTPGGSRPSSPGLPDPFRSPVPLWQQHRGRGACSPGPDAPPQGQTKGLFSGRSHALRLFCLFASPTCLFSSLRSHRGKCLHVVPLGEPGGRGPSKTFPDFSPNLPINLWGQSLPLLPACFQEVGSKQKPIFFFPPSLPPF